MVLGAVYGEIVRGGSWVWCWFAVNGAGDIAPGTVPAVLDKGNISPEVEDTAEKFF